MFVTLCLINKSHETCCPIIAIVTLVVMFLGTYLKFYPKFPSHFVAKTYNVSIKKRTLKLLQSMLETALNSI